MCVGRQGPKNVVQMQMRPFFFLFFSFLFFFRYLTWLDASPFSIIILRHYNAVYAMVHLAKCFRLYWKLVKPQKITNSNNILLVK